MEFAVCCVCLIIYTYIYIHTIMYIYISYVIYIYIYIHLYNLPYTNHGFFSSVLMFVGRLPEFGCRFPSDEPK